MSSERPSARPAGPNGAAGVSEFLDEQLRVAVETTQLGLWSWNINSGEVVWNEQMHRPTGCAQPLDPNQWAERLTHPEDRELVRRAGERAARVGPFEPVMSRILRPTGETRWIMASGNTLADGRGRPSVVVGAVLDVTESQRAAERLQQAQRLETVAHLSAGMAHNFNNMLMIIGPCLEALKRNAADHSPADHRAADEQAQLVQDALDATHRAADIVRQLMRFAGQERELEARRRSAEELVREVARVCQRSFPQHVTLELQVAARCAVNLEAGALEDVLSNVLLNARDAVAQQATGHVRLEATAEERFGELWLSVVITDNGPGMSAELQRRIFYPFFTTKGGRGAGLGLPTSQAIIERLGGQLACRSLPGQGAEFLILVPAEPLLEIASAKTTQAASQQPLHVLLIDDEPAICRMLSLGLQEEGLAVSAFGPSDQLETELRAVGEADVILLDRSLGVLSGKALLPMLRELFPAAKVLFFSGHYVEPAEAALVDGVVEKPVRVAELAAALRAAVGTGTASPER